MWIIFFFIAMNLGIFGNDSWIGWALVGACWNLLQWSILVKGRFKWRAFTMYVILWYFMEYLECKKQTDFLGYHVDLDYNVWAYSSSFVSSLESYGCKFIWEWSI